MDTDAFLELVAVILEVDSGTVSLDDNLESIEWDSLSNLGFIAEVDERAGVEIDADELAKAVTVRDLQALYTAALA